MNYRSSYMGNYSAIKRWTKSAIECYMRGCNCKGCFYEDFFSKPQYGEKGYIRKCQMKASVLELVRVIGTPDGIKEMIVIKDECN